MRVPAKARRGPWRAGFFHDGGPPVRIHLPPAASQANFRVAPRAPMSYREPTLFADNAPRRTMRERLHCGSSCTRKSAGHCAGSSPFRVLGASKRTANIPTHREQFLPQDPALVLRPPGRRGRRLSGFGGQVFRELTGGRYITLRRSDLSKLIYDRISRQDGRVELTELLPRWPSGTAREPKSKGCNSAVRGGGGHRGEQKTPTPACRHLLLY